MITPTPTTPPTSPPATPSASATSATSASVATRPADRWVLSIRALASPVPAIVRLRRASKALFRIYGFKITSMREVVGDGRGAAGGPGMSLTPPSTLTPATPPRASCEAMDPIPPAVVRVRRLLKYMLRTHGLRAIEARELPGDREGKA